MDFDINTIRGLITTVLLFSFLGMVFWAYSSKRKGDFSEAAALPLADEASDGAEEKQS
jgi:cytochrome c oxidase cbb3-type subunit 4